MFNVKGDVDGFNCVEDSYVDEVFPSGNFGSALNLTVECYAENRMRSYLKFDLSSIQGVTVTSVKLCLWQFDSSGASSRTYRVYRVNSSWSEGSVSWSNQPTVDEYVERLGSDSDGQWWNVSVASIFQLETTVSFMIRDEGEGESFSAYTSWHSRENSYKPFLEVSFVHSPVNSYFGLENPSEGSQGCSMKVQHVFRVNVTELDGSEDMDYVEISLDPDGVNLQYRWTQSSDSFSEVYDPYGYCSIVSLAVNSEFVGDQWVLDFKLVFDYNYPDGDLHNVEVFSLDDYGLNDTDVYENVYYVIQGSYSFVLHGPFFEGGGDAGSVNVTVHFDSVGEEQYVLSGELELFFTVDPAFFMWKCGEDDRFYYPNVTVFNVYVPVNPQLYLFTIRDYSGVTGMGDRGYVEFYRPGCGDFPVERHGVADVISGFTACLDVGASYEVVYVNGEVEYRFGRFVAGDDLTEELLIYAQMFNPYLKMAYMYVHADAWRSLPEDLIVVDYEDVNVNTVLVEVYILDKNGTVVWYDNSTVSQVQFQWGEADNETDYVAYVVAEHGEFGSLKFKIPLPYYKTVSNPFLGLEYLGFIGPRERFPIGNLIGMFIVVATCLCFSFLTGPAGMFVVVVTALGLSAVSFVSWTGTFESDVLLLSILGSLAILWALSQARSKNK